MFPKNQTITPKAPDGFYYWIGLDDDHTEDALVLAWYLTLRKRRRFWFDKTVKAVRLAGALQARDVTPAYLDLCARELLQAYHDEQLDKDYARGFGDYVQ